MDARSATGVRIVRLTIVSAQINSVVLPKCRGKILFLTMSGLDFCDLLRENFRERTSVSRSQFLFCMFWCLLAIVSAQIFSVVLPEMPGKIIFLSGLVFCDLFRENFRERTSVSGSQFLFGMFWCFLAIVSEQIFSVFLPEMPGKILFLSGLVFCDLLRENFRERTSVSRSRMFWCLLAIVSARLGGFSPGNPSSCQGFGFLQPFSGTFFTFSVLSSVFCPRLFVLGRVCRRGLRRPLWRSVKSSQDFWGPKASFPPESLAIFPCDGKSLSIAIFFVIFRVKQCPHCGLEAGDAQPPPRGARRKTAPWVKRQRLYMIMVLLLFRICSRRTYLSVLYLVCLLFGLCRAFVQYLCSSIVREKGCRPSAGTASWGSSSVSVKCSCFAFWGRFPGQGVLWNPRVPVPQNDSQDSRGGPWAPPPCDEHSPETL